MRILLLLSFIFILILTSPSVRAAEEVEAYAFYPPGISPMYGLIVRGTVASCSNRCRSKYVINKPTMQ